MSIISKINEYNDSKDKFSYTILVHSTINQELIDTIKKKLDNINKKMNNAFKKKFINERIYSFISHLESAYNQTDEINSIFLINTSVNVIPFSNNDKKFCNTWKISKLIFEHDEEFKIDFLNELMTTKFVKTVFKFESSNYSVIELDSTKSRQIESHSSMDISEIESNVSKLKPVLLYGSNQTLKKLSHLENNKISVMIKNLSHDEVNELIEEKLISENQNKFQEEILNNLQNPNYLDKFIFGKKDIGEAIQNYMIKKLFINQKLFSSLKEKADSSLLNFEIIIVKSLKNGDIGQTLNKDYNGMVGIKYY